MPAGYPNRPGPIDKQIKSHAENHTGIVIFDKTEPRSIYNLVAAKFQEAIERVNPEYYKWTPKGLEKHADLDERDYRLRISFWQEYYNTQDKFLNKISLPGVARGICTMEYLYSTVFFSPIKLAWILYPPANYTKAMEEMLDLSMRNLRDVLMLDHNIPLPPSGDTHTKTGHVRARFDLGLIREKIKIFALLDNRLKGAAIQRVEMSGEHKHAHMNINTTTQEAAQSLDEINAEIERIEKTTGKSLSGGLNVESLSNAVHRVAHKMEVRSDREDPEGYTDHDVLGGTVPSHMKEKK